MSRRALQLVLACALAVSCSQTPQRDSAALPPGPHVVDVDMAEYRFDYNPAIPAGRALFRVRNTGDVAHSLHVLPLGDDVPPIDEQLRGSRRLGIVPFAAAGTRDPGETTTFAVDLAPGMRYAFICFLSDAQGRSHALLGMNSEFRAAGP